MGHIFSRLELTEQIIVVLALAAILLIFWLVIHLRHNREAYKAVQKYLADENNASSQSTMEMLMQRSGRFRKKYVPVVSLCIQHRLLKLSKTTEIFDKESNKAWNLINDLYIIDRDMACELMKQYHEVFLNLLQKKIDARLYVDALNHVYLFERIGSLATSLRHKENRMYKEFENTMHDLISPHIPEIVDKVMDGEIIVFSVTCFIDSFKVRLSREGLLSANNEIIFPTADLVRDPNSLANRREDRIYLYNHTKREVVEFLKYTAGSRLLHEILTELRNRIEVESSHEEYITNKIEKYTSEQLKKLQRLIRMEEEKERELEPFTLYDM